MQITITGPRGCGKTTVAEEIARHLESLGCEVLLYGPSRDRAKLEKKSWRPTPLKSKSNEFSREAKIAIVDSLEPEDERSVSQEYPV